MPAESPQFRLLHDTPARRRRMQVVAAAALLVTAVYLSWRVTTVELSAWWLAVPLLLLEVHAAVGLALHTFSLWNLDAVRPAPRVDSVSDRVAVLIPTYNEPREVLLPTIAAAVALAPAHETWVLDDGDRPEIQALAEELGARYLARRDRRHAKAGNINNALSHVDADVVAILDADHVAGPDFLRSTLGYFSDPDVALVQTPQAFYNDGSFEDVDRRWRRRANAVYREQSLFYRAIQPGKNRWRAAFWCGTGALVRTAALAAVGGVATGSVTEDIQTTIRLHRAGWRTVYHDEVLVRGLAAATLEQYALQRHRWCTGAMQVLRGERLLTRSGLSGAQRLAYTATLFGWFDAYRTLGYVVLPMLVLTSGLSPIAAPMSTFLALFVPTMALQQLALHVLGRGRSRPLPAMIFELIRMTPTMRATSTLLTRGAVGFAVTPKGRATGGRTRGRAPALLLGLLAASAAAGGWYAATLLGLTPVTYATPWVAHSAAAWLAFNACLLILAVSRARDVRFAGERRAGYRFAVNRPANLDGKAVTLLDVSLTGARVSVTDDPQVAYLAGGVHRLQVLLEDGVTEQLCLVRSHERTPDGRLRLGVELLCESAAEQARLMRWALDLPREDGAGTPDEMASAELMEQAMPDEKPPASNRAEDRPRQRTALSMARRTRSGDIR